MKTRALATAAFAILSLRLAAAQPVPYLVADINQTGSDSSSPSGGAVVGSTVFFAAFEPATGTELWKSDGTTTTRVADINPGVGSSTPSQLRAVGSTVYFAATDGTTGMELWKTDGTTTTRVADINPGSGNSSPNGFAAI